MVRKWGCKQYVPPATGPRFGSPVPVLSVACLVMYTKHSYLMSRRYGRRRIDLLPVFPPAVLKRDSAAMRSFNSICPAPFCCAHPC